MGNVIRTSQDKAATADTDLKLAFTPTVGMENDKLERHRKHKQSPNNHSFL